MTILFALAIAAAQPTPAAPVDQSQHAQHQQHAQHMQAMQKHHEQCREMMEKMHQGMKHDGHQAGDAKPGAEHKDHGSR